MPRERVIRFNNHKERSTLYKIDSKQCAALSDEVGTQVPLATGYI
jgi:hypothetical protein